MGRVGTGSHSFVTRTVSSTCCVYQSVKCVFPTRGHPNVWHTIRIGWIEWNVQPNQAADSVASPPPNECPVKRMVSIVSTWFRICSEMDVSNERNSRKNPSCTRICELGNKESNKISISTAKSCRACVPRNTTWRVLSCTKLYPCAIGQSPRNNTGSSFTCSNIGWDACFHRACMSAGDLYARRDRAAENE